MSKHYYSYVGSAIVINDQGTQKAFEYVGTKTDGTPKDASLSSVIYDNISGYSAYITADSQGRTTLTAIEHAVAYYLSENYFYKTGVGGTYSTLIDSVPRDGVLRVWHTGNLGYTCSIKINNVEEYRGGGVRSKTQSVPFDVEVGDLVEVAYAPTVTFYGNLLPTNYP